MAFYFTDYIQYSNVPVKGNVNLSSLEVTEFLLSNVKSIKDIYAITQKLTVLNKPYEPLGYIIPFHWFCVDKNGDCVVIECVNGITMVYDNPYGIMANIPTFPEHVNTILNLPLDYQIPGDYTSRSRFIRLFALQENHFTPTNLLDGVNTTFHIMNSFDIVKGTKYGSRFEYTQYIVVYDLQGINARYKTYNNQNIQLL